MTKGVRHVRYLGDKKSTLKQNKRLVFHSSILRLKKIEDKGVSPNHVACLNYNDKHRRPAGWCLNKGGEIKQ